MKLSKQQASKPDGTKADLQIQDQNLGFFFRNKPLLGSSNMSNWASKIGQAIQFNWTSYLALGLDWELEQEREQILKQKICLELNKYFLSKATKLFSILELGSFQVWATFGLIQHEHGRLVKDCYRYWWECCSIQYWHCSIQLVLVYYYWLRLPLIFSLSRFITYLSISQSSWFKSRKCVNLL